MLHQCPFASFWVCPLQKPRLWAGTGQNPCCWLGSMCSILPTAVRAEVGASSWLNSVSVVWPSGLTMAIQELSPHGKTTINNENTNALHFFLDPADGMCNAGWLKNKSMSNSLFVLVQYCQTCKEKVTGFCTRRHILALEIFKVWEFPSCWYRDGNTFFASFRSA